MKRLTIILGLLCLAFILLVAGLPRLVNTQVFLDRLDRELESALGLPVRIEGGLRLELLPRPGFEVRGVVVENPQGFQGEPAVRLDRAVVRVALLPLLRRQVTVRHVRLEGAQVRLVRDAAGAWNMAAPRAEGASPVETPPIEAQAGSDWSFVVEQVSLSGGEVIVDDRRAGKVVRLGDLELTLGGANDKGFTLGGSATLDAGDVGRLGAVRGRLRWTGGGHGDADGHIVVKRSDLSVALQAVLPGDHAVALDLDAVLGLDMGAGSARLESLKIAAPGLTVQGEARAENLFGEPSGEGVATVRLSDARAFFGLFGDEPPQGLLDRGGEARLAFTAGGDVLTVHEFSFRAGSNEADGMVRVERLSDPMITVELVARRLDLDELAVPDLPDAPRRAGGVSAKAAVTQAVETLQDLDLDLRLRADVLEYEALQARDVDIEIRAHGGSVQSPRFSAELARGRLSGDIRASADHSRLSALLTLAVDELPHNGAAAHAPARAPRNLRGVRLNIDGSPQEWKGALDIPDCNPRDILRILGFDDIKGVDAKALTQAALGLHFSGGENSLEVSRGQLLLDGSKVNIAARVPDLAAGLVQAEIVADRLDLDRYLPLLGSPAPARRKAGQPALERPLGLADLGGDESSLVVKAGQLKVRGMTLRSAEASWTGLGEGRARAALGVQALGGAVSLSGEITQEEKGPRLTAELRAAGLDAVQLQSAVGVQKGLRGKLGAQFRGTAQGDRPADLLASLGATLQASLDNGSLVPAGGEATVFGPLAATLSLKPLPADPGKSMAFQAAVMVRQGTGPHLPNGQADVTGKVVLPRSLDNVQADARLSFSGAWAKLPAGDKSLSAGGRVELDTAKGVARLEGVNVKALGGELKFAAAGQGLGKEPVWRGEFSLSPIAPRLLLDALRGRKVTTRDPGVLANMEAASEFVWGKGLLALNGLRLVLDQTVVTGHATVASFDPPDASFDLEVTELDVDRYRLPRNHPVTDDGPVDMPVKLLSSIKAKGSLRVGKFNIYGITGSNIRTEVTAGGGNITVPWLTADVYGGKLEVAASAQVIKNRLAMRYDFTARQFQLGELIVGMADAPYAGGKADLKTTLTMAGATNDELLETMDGNGRLDVKDGWLLFTKPKAQKVATSLKEFIPAKVAGQAKGTVRPDEATAFGTAGTDIVINDGVIGTAELLIDLPWTYKANAKGGTDLVKEEVDYRVDVRVMRLASIPVAIRGPWEDVQVEINTGAAIVDTATGLVRDAVTLPFRILESLIP